MFDSKKVKTVSLKPLQSLLRKHLTKNNCDTIGGLSFSQLLDRLDVGVNKAEAEYWQAISGCKSGPSDQILEIDCGGQQWVLEVDTLHIYVISTYLRKAPTMFARSLLF